MTNNRIEWSKPLAVVAWSLFTLTLGVLPVQAGIANTKHNLSSGGTQTNRVTAAPAGTTADEICVFCHTPHAADNSAPVPLWNKRLPAGSSYTTYATLQSGSIDGEIMTVGSISLACLSCHDGQQAMDNMINAPGSGNYDVTGGGATGLGYTWVGNVDAQGRMLNTTVAMLGQDLSNDHPIGIQYCGGGVSTTSTAGPCTDPDFVLPATNTINAQQVWWVNTTVAGNTAARQKSDMILYTRTFPTSGSTGPSVECGSCHDPHVEAGTGTPASGLTFLRISNTGSAVCLACHVK